MKTVVFEISGEPCSKANSRQMVLNRKTKRVMFIKSKPAQAYVASFLKQAKSVSSDVPFPIECKLLLHCNIYYSSERKDLDESLIMDCLEKSGIIKNDRLIREKHIYHHIDKEFPRAVIKLEELVS